MTRQAIPPPMQATATTPKTTERFVMTFALQLENTDHHFRQLVAEIF
jgi:hypothetical protein